MQIKSRVKYSKSKPKKKAAASNLSKESKVLAFLASIVNFSGDAIISKTLEGIITSWNPAAEKVFGYTPKEAIGKHISVLIPPHLQEEEHKTIELIRHGKAVDYYETMRITKDGTLIHVSLTVSPIRDLRGHIIGASKILRDITERKKTEARLAASENQFRHALDSMLEGVQIHDFNWRYTYVNDALIKYSRYTREELIGFTPMEKYPGMEQTQLYTMMHRCMTERVTERLEIEFTFPDGSKADFEVSIEPVPQGILLLSIDITERRKAEKKVQKLYEELEKKVIERTAQLENNIQQLKESEEKFQKAFEASAAGITITRLSDSAYLEVNDAFARLTGYSKEELIGRTSIELGIALNLKKREETLRQIKEHGSAKNLEVAIRQKSGQIVEVLAAVETVSIKGQKYAINIIYDITDRKRAEEQLKIVNKELESFSYSVSHDLRAPLRAINGNAKILEEDYIDKLDGDGMDALNAITRNSKRMGILIDDLLAFSKLGRKQVSMSVVDMSALVNSAMEELLTEEIQDRTEINVHTLPPAKIDGSLFKQVWINLLSNAIKYSKNESKTIIEIGASEKGDLVNYFVKDNGVGFDMQYYDKLFGIFNRLHSNEEFEGTGIGLAIVQKIVKRHNGTVWAESQPGEGSCFYFSLPTINS